MTKQKIDEAVTLNVSSESDGMTSSTTFNATDLTELAALLKHAGVQSASFPGPASLTVTSDTVGVGASMSTTINSPDLRSIMNLMEPEFQAIGDMESGNEIKAPETGEEIYDPGMGPDDMTPKDDTLDVEIDDQGNLEVVDDEMDETAEYDYRTRQMEPTEYAGVASKNIVQPSTKRVPARSGDNPLDESQQFPDTEEGAIKCLGYASSHDLTGATAEPDPYTKDVWLVTHKGGRSIVYLDRNDFEDLDESINEADTDPALLKAAKQAKLDSQNGYVQHIDKLPSGGYKISDWMSDDTVLSYSNGRCIGGTDPLEGTDIEPTGDEEIDNLTFKPAKGFGDYFREAVKNRASQVVETPVVVGHTSDDLIAQFHEGEIDEAGRSNWESKVRQYGQPYYLNTDCGYASLESIMQGEGYFDDIPDGLASHATKIGFTVLEIDRNGRKGYNYITGPDNLAPNTKVTCVTRTSTGQKYRPGKFIASFTAKDLSTNYDQVVAALGQLGISPSKKLPVKTFD